MKNVYWGLLVSGNIRLMRIFAGFSGKGVSNDSSVSQTAVFGAFAGYVFGIFRDKADIII